MRKIIVITSRGKNQTFNSKAQAWRELVQELKDKSIEVEGMKAIVGGLNVTLESGEAVLPTRDFTLFLSPVNVKSGAEFDSEDYEFEYEFEDIENLDYGDLKAELKSLRGQANDNDNEDLVQLIGNYTQMSVDALRAKLTEVYSAFGLNQEEEETTEEEEFVSSDTSGLEQRVFEMEYYLNIVNAANESRFYARKEQEKAEVLKTIIE